MRSGIGVRATILTEAGGPVGLGHLARCAALLDALESLGVACRLVVAGEAPDHIAGARPVTLGHWYAPGELREAIHGSDIVVVDSYRAGIEAYEIVSSAVLAPAFIDDTARLRYPAGIVVNANSQASSLDIVVDAGGELLIGVSYQLLRREFVGSPARIVSERVENVLVIAGGIDGVGMTDAAATIVREVFPRSTIDTVSTPRDAAALCKSMGVADLAVSSAGQVLYELSATGTPTVTIAVADNQRAQAVAFEEARAIVYAGRWGEQATLERLRALLADAAPAERRRALSAAGQALVDGGGATRVAKRLVARALGARALIEPATLDDEEAVLELANDPVVRAASFSAEQISPPEHHDWFLRTLSDQDTVLLVVRDGERLVGQIRFSLTGTRAVASISVSAPYRGMGLAARLLVRAEGMLVEGYPRVDTVGAFVKEANSASRRSFEAAGYSRVEGSEVASGAVEYRKTVRGGAAGRER